MRVLRSNDVRPCRYEAEAGPVIYEALWHNIIYTEKLANLEAQADPNLRAPHAPPGPAQHLDRRSTLSIYFETMLNLLPDDLRL